MAEKHTGNYVAYLRSPKLIADTEFVEQEESCRTWLNGGNWKLIDVFKEIETGSGKTRRPQLLKAISICNDQRATLLLAKMGELSSDLNFVEKLFTSNVKFHALDMPVAADQSIHVMYEMAKHRYESLGRRSRAALDALKASGAKLGNPHPDLAMKLGRAMRTKQADDFALEVFPIIQEIRQAGKTTLRAIANELMDRKVLTSLGRSNWGPEQVKKIINRQKSKK